MDFTKTVSLVISGILSNPVIHTLMRISPVTESPIDVLIIRLEPCARCTCLLDQRFDGHLLNVFSPMNDHLTTPRQHPAHGRCLFRQWASATFTFQPMPTTCSSLRRHGHRIAFVTRHTIDFVALHRFR